MKKWTSRFLWLGIFAFLTIQFISVSEAYLYKPYYWANPNVDYKWGPYVPAAMQTATDYGKNQWNAVPGSNFNYTGFSSGSSNTIEYGFVDGAGSILGVTTVSYNFPSGTANWFKVRYDHSENWDWGGGLQSNEYDIESTATHELGHVLGIDHTNLSCSNSDRPTMCSQQPSGNTWFRSLQNDDKYAAAYKY